MARVTITIEDIEDGSDAVAHITTESNWKETEPVSPAVQLAYSLILLVEDIKEQVENEKAGGTD